MASSCRLRSLAAAALAGWVFAPLPALIFAKTPGAVASAGPAASAASALSAKTMLTAVVEASEAQDAFEASVRKHLPGHARFEEIVAELRAVEAVYQELKAPIARGESELAERLVVFDCITRLRSLDGRIDASGRQVAQWADRLDADLDRVVKRDNDLAGWLAIAQDRQAPAALVERLLGLPARHEALAKEVRESRDRAVLLLDEISTLRNQVAARLEEVAARGAAIEERLRAAQGAPIWSADAVVRDDMRSSLALVGGKLMLVGSYLREHAFALLGIGLATMAASLLALAAMGIDLTKVTVLAGALGVGIGFGLQSVINNLLSGLILLVERPVTAGDVVQTGDTQGAVVGIGVRSTTVRTPAGAEVIVPNADLITKVVSNWMLSDSRCRIEIEVNLPSTVDPDHAIRLLQAAAAEVEEVAERPAPSAWLAGLRDGQRSYRLHAWIADYDTQTAVQSPLRVQIQRHFARKAWRCPSTRHPLPLFSP